MEKENKKNASFLSNTLTNREFEIRWYRQNGKYSERIARDGHGQLYLIGDWSWNRNYPEKAETVEPLIRLAKSN
jgi:hypothetical protein